MISKSETSSNMIYGGLIMNNCLCNIFDNEWIWLIIIALLLIFCCSGNGFSNTYGNGCGCGC